MHSEETKRKIAASHLGKKHSEETKRKISESQKGENNYWFGTHGPNYGKESPFKGKHHTEATKQIIRLKRTNQVCSEETRRKMSESRKGARNHNYGKPLSQEQKEYLSQINSGENNPAFGKEGRMSGKHHSEETKQKMRETQLIVQNLPEVKQLKSEKLSGENNPNWNGGPKEYCHKFKNGTFRHRCRAFFNNTCVLCNKPADGETLDVHHVYYNKKACCEVSEDGKYRSDLGIKGSPKTFVIIGEPNKFVPLHHACHSLTTPISVRELYARHFERIINEQYDGKCYFSEEEYKELSK